jgi:hypothetical protein
MVAGGIGPDDGAGRGTGRVATGGGAIGLRSGTCVDAPAQDVSTASETATTTRTDITRRYQTTVGALTTR